MNRNNIVRIRHDKENNGGMTRKTLILLNALLLCIFILCSCRIVNNDEEIFYVSVIQNTEDEVYGIHYEYYIDGEAIGGCMVRNADNSYIEKNDILTKDFSKYDFPKGRDLSKLYIQFFIAAENGNETGTVNPIKISAEYGKRYTVVIEGNYKDGYAAKLNN